MTFLSSEFDDEDEFTLRVVTDEDDHTFVVKDVATARGLLSAVSILRPWIERRSNPDPEKG